jgi:hypothetical protein
MKRINNFFEFVDRFNIPISLRYKDDDNYSTLLGGIVSLSIILIALGFGIYYFIPFAKKENYSLYYYTINLKRTEEINLFKSKTALAFKFDSSNHNNEERYKNLTLDELLELEVEYKIKLEKKDVENKTNIINTHKCNISDFHNDRKLINSEEEKKLASFTCIDDLNKVVKNGYQDTHDVFTYYDIEIKAKNESVIPIIEQFLLDNDCKIELYYVDVKIEVDDYEEPIKPFVNEVFLQLDPSLQLRMNTFFMNSYFESNNDYFFPTKSPQKINNLFSRTEQYFLHRGANTGKDSFGRIYIRADARKLEVKRKYQTVMEYFADAFSFWEDLFLICSIIFNIYNKFSLDHYIKNELFFFKGKNNKYFNISKNGKKIKLLIEKSNNYLNFPKDNVDMKLPKKYDNNKKINDEKQEEINQPINTETSEINIQNSINEKKNDKKINLKNCKYFLRELKYAFIKLKSLLKCKKCKCKKTKLENQLKKADDIINRKLDVIYYIKKMMVLDILYDKIKEDKKEILKFLSIPIIVPNIENDDVDIQIKPYSDIDFDHFVVDYSNFLEKSKGGKDEKKLIELTNEQLRKLDND